MKSIKMRKFTILIFLTLSVGSLNAQDCNECETGNYTINTNLTIENIRDRYQYLISLQPSDFDYIYKDKTITSCNEGDEIETSTYFLNNEISIIIEERKGSGEGGIYLNSITYKYYQNNRLIFTFIISNEIYMNQEDQNTLTQKRIYYDNCGKTIKKLYKTAKASELKNNETLEDLILSKKNIDTTNK